MLTIRDAQRASLAAASRSRFTETLVAHARAHFAADCEALGEAETRSLVAQCLARAEAHRFATERSLARWVNLAFTFGRRFDEEEPWAVEALGGRGAPEEKSTRLLWAAVAHEELARGLDGGRGAR